VLNEFQIGACGDHFSGLETSQKILHVGYFKPLLIKDCIDVVKKCHMCQIFSRKMQEHPAPMFHVIVVGPSTKWGFDFTTFYPASSRGDRYIIMVVDYFTGRIHANI
jgi:hypothetical protein